MSTDISDLDTRKALRIVKLVSFIVWFVFVVGWQLVQGQGLQILGWVLICYINLYFLLGWFLISKETSWLYLSILNHLVATLIVFEILLLHQNDQISFFSFLTVYMMQLQITLSSFKNCSHEVIITLPSIIYVFIRIIFNTNSQIDVTKTVISLTIILLSSVSLFFQSKILKIKLNKTIKKKLSYKTKYQQLNMIMVTKMDPFLMIRKNDMKKEKQQSWPRILSRLRKPKKQQISPQKIKLDYQNYEILLEGQQNFQIFDNSTEIKNMYIIQGKEEPLSLSGHINTFIIECQNNKMNPKENQSLLFENCKLVFKKEDDSRVFPLVVIMPEKDQIVQNQQNSYISPQQNQRRVHFSSIKNKNTDQSTQMQTQQFRVEGRRVNKNSIILKGKYQTEDVLQNLAQLQQQQCKIPKYPQDFTTKRVYEDKIKEIEMQNTHKDFILASVSHDFKTPINGMLALLNALLRTHQNSDNILHLEIIRKNIFLLLYMITDIQDYSKLQNGQLKMNPSRCNIQDIVLDVIELMTIQAQQKKIDLRYQLDMQSYELKSDQNRIKQVLFNLVSNALKFTMRGYILIKIIQEGTNIIKVSVSDTGVGIPDQVKSKLFKLNATFDQKGLNKDGVGLGLVICQNIVHHLGPQQEIQIESIQNVGTTFSFYLYINVPDSKQGSIMVNSFVQFNSKPDGLNFHSSVYLFSKKNIQTIQKLNDVERISSFPEFNENRQSKSLNDEFYNSDDRLNDQQNQVVKNITQHQIVKGNQKPLQNYDNYDSHIKFAPQQKINIMVVDDEPFNVYAFRIMCASQDINLHEAYNGQEAVAKIKLKTQADIGFYYDFIFLDLTMPIMNGYQAAEAILNMIQKEQIKPLHLVAISGYDDIKEKETCLNLGFDAFISKPVEFEYLRQIIGEISPRRKQSQQ